MNNVWLVTGSASGLGRNFAEAVAASERNRSDNAPHYRSPFVAKNERKIFGTKGSQCRGARVRYRVCSNPRTRLSGGWGGSQADATCIKVT
jgi:hypothetical protein